MIGMKWGVLRYRICFYFAVYVLQLYTLLIIFLSKKTLITKCEFHNESFPSPFKSHPSPFFLFPPLRKKGIKHLWNCSNTIIICNKRTRNRNTFFTIMVSKPKNIMIRILFRLFNIILFMLWPYWYNCVFVCF